MKHSYHFNPGWVLGAIMMVTVPFLAMANGQGPTPRGKISGNGANLPF